MRKRIKQIAKAALGLSAPAPHRSASSYKDWWGAAGATDESAKIATIDRMSEDEYRMRGRHGDANSYGALELIRRAGLNAQSTALEIGCGMARIGREMAPHIGQWHGADISPSMLGHAKARTSHLSNVYLHEIASADPTSLAQQALEPASFDFVYSTIVLMHLDKEDMFEYLKQARRLLKPQAIAYFDTWNILHPDTFRIWREAARLGDAKPRGRIQGASPDEFRLYLEEAGYVVQQLDRTDRLVRAWVRPAQSLPAPHATAPIADESAPTSAAGDGWAPFGYVSSPRVADQLTATTLEVAGWTLDRVEKVRVWAESVDAQGPRTAVVEAQLGQSRPEVAALFTRYGTAAATCGWIAQLPVGDLPPGEYRIRAMAQDSEHLEADMAGVSLVVVKP